MPWPTSARVVIELTEAVWFYLRGEEYSAQLDHFVRRVQRRELDGLNSFTSAAVTDRALELLTIDAARGPVTTDEAVAAPPDGRRARRGRRP